MNNKEHLIDKISQNQMSMYELKKQSKVSITSSNQAAASNTGAKNSKKKDEGELNLEDILNDLNRDILRIYKTAINPNADLTTRNPIDLLTVRILLSIN